MTDETWRPVLGTDGRYSVSDQGSVRSHLRKQPQALRPTIAKNGYPTVNLSLTHRRWVTPVHVLVCLSFLGPRPPGHEVRHLDGNKLNNHLDNLLWGTPLENAADRIRHGTTRASQTHCKHGHEFTPENTQLAADGSRRHCRSCARLRNVAWKEAHPKPKREPRPPKPRGLASTCRRGHDMSEAYVLKSGPQAGRRQCRTCHLDRARAYAVARQQQGVAA